jgi:hypothetical protein
MSTKEGISLIHYNYGRKQDLIFDVDDDVRVVIHPKPRPEDDDERYHRQYILSHKSYNPGNF